MTIIVERIGPMRALIYSKVFSPRRFRLVPVALLPPEVRVGETIEMPDRAFYRAITAVPSRTPAPAATPAIRASY